MPALHHMDSELFQYSYYFCLMFPYDSIRNTALKIRYVNLAEIYVAVQTKLDVT